MGKKYEFVPYRTKIFRGVPHREITLHRIRAVSDIHPNPINRDRIAAIIRRSMNLRGNDLENRVDQLLLFFYERETIYAGQLGGWIESEANLDQHGTCWVGGSAIVTGNARVTDHAHVTDHAWLNDLACASGHALVKGQAQLHGQAEISSFAQIKGFAMLEDRAHVFDCATIKDHARCYGAARIGGIVNADGFTAINAPCCRQDEVPKWYPARTKRSLRSYYLAAL